MLCPPQQAQGPLSQALASRSDARRRSSSAGAGGGGGGGGSSFAAFIAKANAAGHGKQKQISMGTNRSQVPLLQVRRPTQSSYVNEKDSPAEQINLIGRAIRSIFACPAEGRLDAGQSFETLYQATDDVVLIAKQAGNLYDRFKLELERAVGQVAISLRAGASMEAQGDATAQQAWLTQLCAAWTGWCDRCTLVCRILTLLDQAYLLEHREMPSLWGMSLDMFKHSIAEDDDLQGRILSSVDGVCNSMRNGKANGYRELHVSVLSMFSELSLYSALQQKLLASTESFFALESSKVIASVDTASYLAYAQQRVEQEHRYAEWLYADEHGRTKSSLIVHHQLVKAHIDKLVSGLPVLLEEASTTALSLLYGFLSTVNELTALRTAFGQYVRQRGEQIVVDREKDEQMIDLLLEYKATIDKVVSGPFKGDGNFRQTQKESFEMFVNKRENKAAELIGKCNDRIFVDVHNLIACATAKFLDARLRSGNKTMSDQELEHVLNEALILFRYTHAKDMFEEFYKRLFAKRLLLNRSASSDAEQSMLLKLKEECGPAFTQKLETMLTDVALSEEMMKAYDAAREKAVGQGDVDLFEMSVNVLTQAHWPTYPQVDVILPPEMAIATEQFARFYETRNQGRKLYWAHSLGTTSLTAHFAKAGEKELLVSTFQTIILLLFNGLPPGAKLSYLEIQQQTGMEEKELKRTLQSLACGQIPTRVLRKDPQGKDVNEGDHFLVNEQLKNDRKRIRINMIQLNETQEEQKSTVDRVMFDRDLVLQATAVRILKARKTIKHAELLQEIVQSIAS